MSSYFPPSGIVPGDGPSRPVVDRVLDVDPLLEDKVPPLLHLLAHQRPEQVVRLLGIDEGYPQQDPLLRVERRLPQLLRVHLAQALEPGDGQTALADPPDLVDQVAQVG